jgi:Tol biopolymer transport system component
MVGIMPIVEKISVRTLLLVVLLAGASCGKGGDSVKPNPTDTTAPVITAGPTVRSITEISATVTWFTDDASKSLVLYSTDMSFGSAVGDSALVTSHSLNLTGLAVGTTYHVRVQSCNAVNMITRSAAITFATRSTAPSSAGRIVFATSRDGNSEIYSMNMDGTNQARLTNRPDEEMYPAWSPDRSRIALVAFTPNQVGTEDKDVIVMNADGSGWKDITPVTHNDNHPAWSPDGARIAFSRFVVDRESWEIFVMDADGSNATPLTWDDGLDDEPSWSPDGTKITFIGTRDGYSEVFVMNANGTGRSPVTQDSVMVYTPCWSPDGTRIAYVRQYISDQGSEHDVAIINADGTSPVRVTHGSSALMVSWDPDGAHLVYAATYPSDIHRIAVDGSGDVNLTNAAGRDYDPDCR